LKDLTPLLIKNPKQILTMALPGQKGPRKGKAMREIGLLGEGFGILIEGEKIKRIAKLGEFKGFDKKKTKVIDATGKVILPGFVDSHTHAIFAGSRLKDFELRNRGASYQEIAARGGGILSSVEKVRATSKAVLMNNLIARSQQALRHGITTMEVKTGYGLSVEDEEKLLLAIGQAQKKTPLELAVTFLGAHAIPGEYKNNAQGYLDLVIAKMLPKFKKLAEFADVFCEEGYFGKEDSAGLLSEAKKLGYKIKIHAEQLTDNGGSEVACDLSGTSVDHLDNISDQNIAKLARSNVVATLVPGSNFFLKTKTFPPARKLVDSGAAVALSTDFNPGTSPTLNMSFVISLAVIYMGMTIEESLVAATINGAWALDRGERLGSIEVGKQADLAIFDVADYREIPYYFAMNPVARVIKKGNVVYGK